MGKRAQQQGWRAWLLLRLLLTDDWGGDDDCGG
jgi:hypothetical protein